MFRAESICLFPDWVTMLLPRLIEIVILLDASFFASNTHFDPVMLATWAHGAFKAPGIHNLQRHGLLVDGLLP